MWGVDSFGLQGVTELTECERCDDPWLQEVQEEIRCGKLSVDNHAFLHGKPTSVPGSWCNGVAQCKNKKCQALGDRPQAKRKGKECAVCQAERESKRLVALSPEDSRFATEQFAKAFAIVANNVVKYDVNKKRAQRFASRSNESVTYSCAKDFASYLASLRCLCSCNRLW